LQASIGKYRGCGEKLLKGAFYPHSPIERRSMAISGLHIAICVAGELRANVVDAVPISY
jgi:hypothetical protein